MHRETSFPLVRRSVFSDSLVIFRQVYRVRVPRCKAISIFQYVWASSRAEDRYDSIADTPPSHFVNSQERRIEGALAEWAAIKSIAKNSAISFLRSLKKHFFHSSLLDEESFIGSFLFFFSQSARELLIFLKRKISRN